MYTQLPPKFGKQNSHFRLHLASWITRLTCYCMFLSILTVMPTVRSDEPQQSGNSQTEPLATPDSEEDSTSEPSATDGTSEEVDNSEDVNPFPRRIAAPRFPVNMEWINVEKPLKMADLKGRFVLLDFWTYCCINCMHILPELKQLEKKFPVELVVIGVHSAKFDTEQNRQNIEEAVMRYEIEHAVVNDFKHEIWNTYGVNSWPTMLLIDPEGDVVYGRSGEFKAEEVEAVIKRALPYYQKQNKLAKTPIRFKLSAEQSVPTPLRFPGKVVADAKSQRLFVADSNHNRIVVADLSGILLATIGNGHIGKADGDYSSATFNHPQGMFFDGDSLFIADTENHLLREVDLQTKNRNHDCWHRRTRWCLAGTGKTKTNRPATNEVGWKTSGNVAQ